MIWITPDKLHEVFYVNDDVDDDDLLPLAFRSPQLLQLFGRTL